jgi:hypothetical protein
LPSRIHAYGKPSQSTTAQRIAEKEEEEQRIVAIGRAPWLGYCPDIPPHLLRYLAGFQQCQGVVARSRGHGEVLTQDYGHEEIADFAVTSAAGLTGAEDFQLADGSNEPVFIYGGDGAANSVELARLTSALALVQLDPFPSPLGTVPLGDRDVLWDCAAFPAGAPTRNYGAAYNGIDVPCLVMCGGDENGPTEPVLITPAEDPVTTMDYDEYMELWETTFPAAAVSGPLHPFLAKSCEAFAGRMNWLNTTEGTVKHPNRLRWGAVGTADPAEANVGAGRLDMGEFKRHGLRVETLGNQLACYFGDGVAFVTRTGSPVDPYRYQVISKTRGLLSTHSLCAYHANVHFGIFDDGWWKLNSSGQWEPVGVIEVPEGGGREVLMHKWRNTFYSQLDLDRRHQITTVYDPETRSIRIAWPQVGNTHMVVWTYDVDQDRVWPYGTVDMTQWASVNRITQAGTLINSLTNPIDSYTNKIDEWGAKVGLKSILHGQAGGGSLMGWESTSLLKLGFGGGTLQASWTTHAFAPTEDPEKTSTLTRAGIEYVSYGEAGPAFSITDTADNTASGEVQTRTVLGNEGVSGNLQYGFAHFDHHAELHKLSYSTSAPFEVRAMRLQFETIGGDARTTTRG